MPATATCYIKLHTAVSFNTADIVSSSGDHKDDDACLQSSSVLSGEKGGPTGRELAIYIKLKWFKTRLRTGPVLGFGPAGFLLTRTGAGPFFGPAPVHVF